MSTNRPSICRSCKKPFRDFGALREHHQLDHPEYFQKVQHWLGDEIETKLKVLEVQIQEGRLKSKPQGDI
jgi:hypothetical protein